MQSLLLNTPTRSYSNFLNNSTMSHKPSTRPARHHVGSKELALQEREEAFDVPVWDGKSERENQRKAPSLPMKWHSNKWVERIFE